MTKARKRLLNRRGQHLSRLSAELAYLANEARANLGADAAQLIEEASMKLASASARYFDAIESGTT